MPPAHGALGSEQDFIRRASRPASFPGDCTQLAQSLHVRSVSAEHFPRLQLERGAMEQPHCSIEVGSSRNVREDRSTCRAANYIQKTLHAEIDLGHELASDGQALAQEISLVSPSGEVDSKRSPDGVRLDRGREKSRKTFESTLFPDLLHSCNPEPVDSLFPLQRVRVAAIQLVVGKPDPRVRK